MFSQSYPCLPLYPLRGIVLLPRPVILVMKSSTVNIVAPFCLCVVSCKLECHAMQKMQFEPVCLECVDYGGWRRADPSNPHRAKHTFCQMIDLVIVGASALKSYLRSSKHICRSAACRSSYAIRNCMCSGKGLFQSFNY